MYNASIDAKKCNRKGVGAWNVVNIRIRTDNCKSITNLWNGLPNIGILDSNYKQE